MTERQEWIARRALIELTELAYRGDDVHTVLCAFEAPPAKLVDTYASFARPQGTNGHRVHVWPDAPTGLRKRDIRLGLQQAARLWREQHALTAT